MRRLLVWLPVLLVLAFMSGRRPVAQGREIVLYASDFADLHGNWAVVDSASSPEGHALASEDRGWDTRPVPLAEPQDYVQAAFSTEANTPYRVWLRLRAADNSKWNDSVWVQFDNALIQEDGAQAPAYAIGSTSALLVNLERCYACGDRNWGWQDRAWWTGQSAVVRFPTTGPHTIRIQTREDGVQVDQVVLSPAAYFEEAPGDDRDDATMVARSGAATTLDPASPEGAPVAPPPAPTVTAGSPASAGQTSSSPSVAATPAPSAVPDATSHTVHVLTWNIDIAVQSETTARQQMDTITALPAAPRILVIEEARQSLYQVYLGELQARTGRPWTGVFQPHCARGAWDENGGRCTALEDEGVMILTSFPVTGQDTRLLPSADCWHSARGAVHAAIEVNGVVVQVYGVHLPTGRCSDVATERRNAVAALVAWASRSPAPRIAAGDFNATTDAPEISDTAAGMASLFSDTWATAGGGVANTYPVKSPATKIDYWFQDRSGRTRATESRVETSATQSDHYPLSTTFVVSR